MRRLGRRPSVLVVGNGSIGVDREGRRFIHDGTGRFLLDLVGRGAAVIYAELATDYARNANLQNFCLDDHGLVSVLVPARRSARAAAALAALAWRALDADIVYAFYPGTLSIGALRIRRFARRPYGLYVRGSQFAIHGVDRGFLEAASFALTVSPAIEQELRTVCRTTGTIRPMLGMDAADRLDRPVRRSPPASWTLLFVGRLEEDKGLWDIVEAARLLAARGLPFRLRLVGGGPLFEALRAVAAGEPLNGRLEVVGEVSSTREMLDEYARADLLICASYHEGFPRVLYEAMLAGLPIVTTFVGGIPGRMRDGANCIGIPERNPAAIASAVEKLTGDLALLDRLGRAGQDTVLGVLEGHRPHAELVMEMIDGRV